MITSAASAPIDLLSKKAKRTYTFAEYLQKEQKSKEKHEFINGQIIRMPFAKGPHNIISANVSAGMTIEFDKKETNFIVFSSDQKIYFPSLDEGVYADALAVCERPIYWDNNQLLLINPILVVEVLSRSTSAYDRGGKFSKYKTLESFKEYVLIRQDTHEVEVWYREKLGFWQETCITDLNSEVQLQSVDISLSMKRIYKNVEL